MNLALNCLSLFFIGIGLYQIITAFYALPRERKQMHHLFAPHERMTPWYTDALFRKQSVSLISGVLLVMVAVGLLAFSNHAPVFGFFWISLTAFLYSCSNGLLTFFQEAGQRGGEKRYYWLHQSRFYQGIAVSLFCIGINIAALLGGLVFAKITTFDITDQLAWAWETPMLVSALMWLIAWIIPIIRKNYKH